MCLEWLFWHLIVPKFSRWPVLQIEVIVFPSFCACTKVRFLTFGLTIFRIPFSLVKAYFADNDYLQAGSWYLYSTSVCFKFVPPHCQIWITVVQGLRVVKQPCTIGYHGMIGTRLCKYEQRSNIIKNVINFLFELDFMFSSIHFWVDCFKQSSHSIQTQKTSFW